MRLTNSGLRMFGLVGLAALVAFGIAYRPDRAIRVATAVVAHDLCAKVLVTGESVEAAKTEVLDNPGIRRLRRVVSATVYREAWLVTATAFGGVISSRADLRPGAGCGLRYEGHAADAVTITKLQRFVAPSDPQVSTPVAPALREALDRAFEERPVPPLRRTKAIVVMRDGKIIAERYAPGTGINTPLLGYSVSKSVVNALVGILVHQGKLSLTQAAPVPAWSAPGDPRRAITIDHLLRMTTGLALDETNSGFDASSRIVYLEADTATAATSAKVIAAPGTRFAYSSPSTILASRIVQDAVGGSPQQMVEFVDRELFAPLGIMTATIEFDAVGTMLGNANIFASARDWGRFGQLYLDDGMVGGRRVLPPGWSGASASPSPKTYYGAGFWSAAGDHPWPRRWQELGIPAEAFWASGHLGQRVLILPSLRLVIVRMGAATDESGDMVGFARLVRDVAAAVR
jgi:CubicO group peptidase (beta-lactamase class C family)